MTFRVIHRYLGFFLAGIMAVYALSGTLMIFRNTDFLKKEEVVERKIEANLAPQAIGQALRIRGFKVERQEGDVVYFRDGFYNKATGEASVTVKKLPFFLDKMTKMHKATTNSPLFFLNIFFGASLLFFAVSAYFMFKPTTTVFKNSLIWTAVGIVLTFIILFV